MTDHSAPEFLGSVSFTEGGLVQLDQAEVAARAFHQSPPDVAARAAGRTRPMAMGAASPPTVTGVGWRQIPSTYVVCSEDRLILPESQRLWAKERATDSVELPYDHCPQASHPAEVAEVLARAVVAATPAT